MNRTPDVELVLREFFADDGLTAPDYVLDAVEERIARQPRRPAWRLRGRPFVNGTVKIAAALAAVLVVAVVGYNLLPGTTGPGAPTTAPTPTAQPTTAATAAPSVSALFPEWWESDGAPTGAGILAPGSHSTHAFMPAFTFTVPDGWVNSSDEANFVELFPETPANEEEFTRSGTLTNNIVMGFQSRPWFSCEALESNSGNTTAEVVEAVTANEILAVSGLIDVTIGGLSGKRFDVRRSPDWTGTCAGDAELPSGVDPLDERARVVLLDVPGRGMLLMLLYSRSSADFEPYATEATTIVESFEFDLGQ
jgi:hypothetical protein